MKDVLSTSLLAAVACGVGGCSSGPAADSGGGTGLFGGDRPRQQLVNVDNGLEVRKWVLVDDPTRIAAELMKVAEPMDLDAELVARFEQNGFRLVRIPDTALDELGESLGGVTQDHSEWLGQSPLWQSLHATAVQRGGQAVAVDGAVNRYENGKFQFMARAWTLPTEDGPHVQVEMLPQFTKNRAIDYRDLLEGTSEQPTQFPSLAMTLRLQPGHAYALIGAAPHQQWPGDEDTTPRGQGSRGPGGGGFGPNTMAPKTLGEVMLLSDGSPPLRGIMIFVAKIPTDLYPAGYARVQAGQQPMENAGGQ